jgi:pimeloyl-ACP methyl ester carboxylesterase
MAHELRHALWVAGLALGGTLVALSATIALYVLGSFALMLGHTPARPFGVSLRELMREIVFASLTQPLLPLYYFVGRRMGDGEGARATHRTPIVLVHGYMQNRVGFLGLARALRKRGLGPIYAINYPWFASLSGNAARLERFVARVCGETKTDAVDLVCHSMGGLVAMEMMRDEARKDALKVRRVVTIATPHAGVAWKGPMIGIGARNLRRGSKLLEAHATYSIAVPCLSIYSTHDNVVHPKETSSLVKRGGMDYEVEGASHLAILFNPVVAREVGAFLAEPSA